MFDRKQNTICFYSKREMQTLSLICCSFIFVIASTGCKPNDEKSSVVNLNSPQEIDTEHKHFPQHWPEDILRANIRIAEILNHTHSPSHDTSLELSSIDQNGITESKELADLFAWLPMLAADSDLDRKEFNRIDHWSNAWTEKLRKHASKSAQLTDLPELDQLQQIAKELDAICVAYQAQLDEQARRYSE